MRICHGGALRTIRADEMSDMTGRTTLAGVTVQLGHGRVKTLAELVDGWAQHVDRLYGERHSATEDRPVWGAHDYLGALHLRTIVASALAQQGTAVRKIADTLVATADEQFLSFTEPDLEHVVERFADQRHDDPEWWWHRIPASGPVRIELLRVVDGV